MQLHFILLTPDPRPSPSSLQNPVPPTYTGVHQKNMCCPRTKPVIQKKKTSLCDLYIIFCQFPSRNSDSKRTNISSNLSIQKKNESVLPPIQQTCCTRLSYQNSEAPTSPCWMEPKNWSSPLKRMDTLAPGSLHHQCCSYPYCNSTPSSLWVLTRSVSFSDTIPP